MVKKDGVMKSLAGGDLWTTTIPEANDGDWWFRQRTSTVVSIIFRTFVFEVLGC